MEQVEYKMKYVQEKEEELSGTLRACSDFKSAAVPGRGGVIELVVDRRNEAE